MELRQLRHFLAVVDAGSFSRAAAALHVSQPSLSVSVRQLEREVGERLLVRGPHGAAPTPAGALFARHARSVLREADKAVEEVGRLRSLRQGRVTFGLTAVFSTFIAPAAIAAFHRAHPGIDVVADVSTHPWAQIEDNIAAGAWDFAFALLRPDSVSNEALTVEPLAEFESGVYAAANHPLARRARVGVAALAEFTWLVSSYTQGGAFLERAFAAAGQPQSKARAGARPEVRVVSNSFNLMKDLLEQHPFLCVLPHRFVARDVAAGHLVRLRQDTIKVSSRAGLVRSARTEPTSAASDLMEALRVASRAV
ncbi:MAG: LysR family transcriptional regulator [Rhodospirillaceae bacterium]|nr:LysR family transcriptional regulator [Rhodospirillaceae bacterium]